jgi:L-cysteine/cystine lyase
LYASQGGLDKLQPTYVGWRGVGLKDGNSPSRFEVATSPFPLLAGLKKSIEFHQQQAPAAVRYRAICRKTALLRAELQKIKDIEFLVEEQPASSLVAFRMRNNQPADIVKTLESERTYLRTIPKPECIRASIHYFTDDEQIKSLAQRLARFSSM